MPGPNPGPCPACGGPKNSYVDLCHFCDTIDADHYITPEGSVGVIPHMGLAKRLAWQKGLDSFVD